MTEQEKTSNGDFPLTPPIVGPVNGTEMPITFNDFGIQGAVFYVGTGNTAEEDSGETDDDFLLDEEIEQNLSHLIEDDKSPLEKSSRS